MSFRALVTEKDPDGTVSSSVQMLDDDRLPEGNVAVDVEWAGLNYKDGLCLTGASGLVRTYPHVAGIDLAGTVRESSDPRYAPGQPVVLTGWRVGETHWGGFAERALVNADWLVPLPDRLSTRDAMIVGTAGLTAMLAINKLEDAGLRPDGGEVLVTGAAGGVGSLAVSMLGSLGYQVAALSGRPQHEQALRALGATSIVNRSEFLSQPDKPLESAKWVAAIDNVGGAILGKLLKQIRYGGAVASVGNAAGIELSTNVLPFILRGVTLIGIDSVMQPYKTRVAAWRRIVEVFDLERYGGMVREIGLEDLPSVAREILTGQIAGRVLVRPR